MVLPAMFLAGISFHWVSIRLGWAGGLDVWPSKWFGWLGFTVQVPWLGKWRDWASGLAG
jgi:hypothetical protein